MELCRHTQCCRRMKKAVLKLKFSMLLAVCPAIRTMKGWLAWLAAGLFHLSTGLSPCLALPYGMSSLFHHIHMHISIRCYMVSLIPGLKLTQIANESDISLFKWHKLYYFSAPHAQPHPENPLINPGDDDLSDFKWTPHARWMFDALLKKKIRYQMFWKFYRILVFSCLSNDRYI